MVPAAGRGRRTAKESKIEKRKKKTEEILIGRIKEKARERRRRWNGRPQCR